MICQMEILWWILMILQEQGKVKICFIGCRKSYDRYKNTFSSKNKFQRRLDSEQQESDEYFYDPKTGRRRRICDSVWSPTRREKKDFQFADNGIPHGEHCGPDCPHLQRASLHKRKYHRKVLRMNTGYVEQLD